MISRIAASCMLAVIHVYRATLSPFLGRQCRFHPTCSTYGLEAIRTYGPWLGGWMTIKRILRCNPFTRGGYDPVPPRTEPHPQETHS